MCLCSSGPSESQLGPGSCMVLTASGCRVWRGGSCPPNLLAEGLPYTIWVSTGSRDPFFVPWPSFKLIWDCNSQGNVLIWEVWAEQGCLMENSRRRERTSRATSAFDMGQILSSCEVPSVSGSVWCSNVGEIRLLLALVWQGGKYPC